MVAKAGVEAAGQITVGLLQKDAQRDALRDSRNARREQAEYAAFIGLAESEVEGARVRPLTLAEAEAVYADAGRTVYENAVRRFEWHARRIPRDGGQTALVRDAARRVQTAILDNARSTILTGNPAKLAGLGAGALGLLVMLAVGLSNLRDHVPADGEELHPLHPLKLPTDDA
jgi:hypothetical protein